MARGQGRHSDAHAASRGRRRRGPEPNRGGTRSGTRQHHRRRPRGPAVFLGLPEELIRAFVLPCLLWPDTSAMACVCKRWAQQLRRARAEYAAWECIVSGGGSLEGALDAVLAAAARGDRGLRFPPTLMILTLSVAPGVNDGPHRGRRQHRADAWPSVIGALESHELLPPQCRLVGFVNGARIPVDEPVDETDDDSFQITISMGHFPATSVDLAIFDRRELRWSASGLTEELDCPFSTQDSGSEDPGSAPPSTSLLLFSTNPKPAEALLALTAQWYPDAPIAGAVVALWEMMEPLVVYTRPLRSLSTRHRRPQPQTSRRKTRNGDGKSMAHGVEDGVLRYPSTLLLRLHGRVGLRPFGVNMDVPLSPVLRCETVVHIAPHDHIRDAYRVYEEVTAIGKEGHMRVPFEVVHDEAQRRAAAWQDDGFVDIELLASKSLQQAVAIANAFYGARPLSEQELNILTGADVRRVRVEAGRQGLLSVGENDWKSGEFGILVARRSSVIPESVHDARATATAAVKLDQRSAFGEILLVARAYSSSATSLHPRDLRVPLSPTFFVDHEIHPTAFPRQSAQTTRSCIHHGAVGGVYLTM